MCDGREHNHSLQTNLTQNSLEGSVSLFLNRVALLSIVHMCWTDVNHRLTIGLLAC